MREHLQNHGSVSYLVREVRDAEKDGGEDWRRRSSHAPSIHPTFGFPACSALVPDFSSMVPAPHPHICHPFLLEDRG